jgi:hypothetical protein
MSKKSGDARRGMDWVLVSQNVAIGVAVVILHQLAFGMGLIQLPLVGVLFAYFMPLAFVVLMTYFRSEQRTKGQAVAEGIFAGFIFLAVILLVSALLSFLGAQAA